MLWRGQVMWGMMVYDSLRAVDYLGSRPRRRFRQNWHPGSLHGQHNGMVGCRSRHPNSRVHLHICCLTDFDALMDTNDLDRHGFYYFVAGLLKHFTTSQINALIASGPHLRLAGNYDKLTPIAGLDRIGAELTEAYASAGAPDAWKLLRYDTGHFETADMRSQILTYLRKWF
jgi:hypothetical protein